MRSDDRGAFRDCPGGQDQRIGWEIDQVEAVGKRSEEGDGVSRDDHRLEERSNGPAKWPRNKTMTRHRARISAPARVTSGLVCPIDGSQCPSEISAMPYDWPEDTDFALWELNVLDRNCPTCGRMMHVCDHRSRRFHTLQGPVELTCRLDHCPDPDCPGHP